MKMSQATSKSRDLDVKFGEDAVLHITYKPVTYTVREMEEAQNSQDVGRVVELIQRTVLKWDLTDDEGAEIPLEAEALKDVPLNIFHGIFTSIGKDQSPDPEA